MKTWGVYILAALGFAIYGAATEADRDGSGAIIDAGSVDAFNVEIGDCFDDTSFDEVSSLPGVPCSQPHDNEAYAVFDVSLDSYPDVDAMSELANGSCVERFEGFVGRDYESSSLDVIAMYPTPESWSQNDREVVCAVYDMEAVKLTGSVKGLGL
jgi:hypothetical protein